MPKLIPTLFTHRQLVNIAYRWVLNNAQCGIAFRELYTNCCNGEYPDVIGFGSWGHSVLIECKTSRADYRADAKKLFRIYPEQGMGRYRFYCCPTGIIKPEELPDKWGLIYVSDKGKAKSIINPYNGNRSEFSNIWTDGFIQNMKAEHGLMYSALRRLHKRRLIDAIYLPEDVPYTPSE